MVHGQAVSAHPVSEPQLRVLPGELRRDPEGRAMVLPGQPSVARRRGHEPLLRRQWQAPLELLLQQLSASMHVHIASEMVGGWGWSPLLQLS